MGWNSRCCTAMRRRRGCCTPGGQLVFLTNSFLMALCTPDDADVAATDRLQRPAHGMYRLQGPSEHGFVTREWARQWPSEEVWKLRKRG